MEACEVGKNRHACRLVSDSTKTKKITRPINETVHTSRLSCCERTEAAMAPNSHMFGSTVREVLAHPNVDLEDKGRMFKLFKQMYTTGNVSMMPLEEGDAVTLTGLTTDRSLNGEKGVLGTFENGRWNVPSLVTRVRPKNLIKAEWLKDSRFNTSISANGTTYIMRVEPDEVVRCLTPSGMGGRMLLMKCPWDDMWLRGFNREIPEQSDLYLDPFDDS